MDTQGARVGLPEGVQDGAARLFAGDGLELQQGRLGLLLQGGVDRADRNNQPRGLLRERSDEATTEKQEDRATNHARAGKHIPTQPDAIAVLHLTPLVLKSLVVHLEIVCARLLYINSVPISCWRESNLAICLARWIPELWGCRWVQLGSGIGPVVSEGKCR